jgi:uncharacterized protein YbcC (UPF0753/DUF2309 family)
MKNNNVDFKILKACNRVAPAWPLKNFVAVNPYMGMSDMSFKDAAKYLKKQAGINLYMDLDFYFDKVKRSIINFEDLKNSFEKNSLPNYSVVKFLDHLKIKLKSDLSDKRANNDINQSVTDLASILGEYDYSKFMIDNISKWAASYFDENPGFMQSENKPSNIFSAWKKDALIDKSTDILGLKTFKNVLRELPDDSKIANRYMLEELKVGDDYTEDYIHALFLKIIGWSSFIKGIDWNNNLYSGKTDKLESFLSILLAWELSLYRYYKKDKIDRLFEIRLKEYKEFTSEIEEDINFKNILQDAYDLSIQRNLKSSFSKFNLIKPSIYRPRFQAAFCIDVRSEIYRRNLESLSEEIDTIGTAGFFGFPINVKPIGHDHGNDQCPVLIPSAHNVKERVHDHVTTEKIKKTRIVKNQVEKAWKWFKSGPVSSFSFVSPLGMSYLPKLISDTFSLTSPVQRPSQSGLNKALVDEVGIDISDISFSQRVEMAYSSLKGMGLTYNFSRVVIIAGHGSSSVNNPHSSSYECGACGGNSGKANAMVGEMILNDKMVRKALAEKGVKIPSDSIFAAALHDTSTDDLIILNENGIPKSHQQDMEYVKRYLTLASDVLTEGWVT